MESVDGVFITKTEENVRASRVFMFKADENVRASRFRNFVALKYVRASLVFILEIIVLLCFPDISVTKTLYCRTKMS